MKRLTFAVVTVLIFGGLFASWSTAQEISGVKCVVEGDRNADEKFKVDYADGEVYFCCKGCAATFAADNAQYQTQANHQLVVTGQFKQTACPIAGEDFDADHKSKVGGVEVAFCCENCKAKVDAAADLAAKAELVFGAEPFKRAFAKSEQAVDFSKVKCLIQPKLAVKEEVVADYRGGKVYFCCASCAKDFQADPTKYAAQANLQLVSTKQFVQTKCPLTDAEVDGSKTITVGGQKVAFCCGSCIANVESAPEDERVAMVFDDAVFEKSFSKAESAESEDYSVAPEGLGAPGK